MEQEREVFFCEDCGRMGIWLSAIDAIAHEEKCYYCGSKNISRGQTGDEGKVR